MGFFNKLQELAFGTESNQPKESMYPPQLENLINIALKDGNITDKERQVLYKKAAEFNVDPDELDMILESKLDMTTVNPRVKNKDKGQKKCPACGSPITDPNMLHCPYCDAKVIDIIQDLLDELDYVKQANKKQNQNKGIFGLMFSDDTDDQEREIIFNYKVPMIKEVIVEFLDYSVSKSKDSGEYEEVKLIWYEKSEQVISKARRSFAQDADFMATLKDYAVELGMEKEEKKGWFSR